MNEVRPYSIFQLQHTDVNIIQLYTTFTDNTGICDNICDFLVLWKQDLLQTLLVTQSASTKHRKVHVKLGLCLRHTVVRNDLFKSPFTWKQN